MGLIWLRREHLQPNWQAEVAGLRATPKYVQTHLKKQKRELLTCLVPQLLRQQ